MNTRQRKKRLKQIQSLMAHCFTHKKKHRSVSEKHARFLFRLMAASYQKR